MAKDPAVSSIEYDCLVRAAMSPPESDDSSPGDHDMHQVEAVARRLSVQTNAPWNLDRIDGIDYGVYHYVSHYNDGNLKGKGVRVYVVDGGVQAGHAEFAWSMGSGVVGPRLSRVVNGHTVRAAPQSPLAHAHRPCHVRPPAIYHAP